MKTNALTQWSGAVLQVFFPNSCRACSVRISDGRLLCAPCFKLLMECVIPECEWPGKTPLGRMVTGQFYYRTESPIRSIHRAAKFQADPDAARLLGELLGNRLRNRDRFPDIEICIPVSSHRTKIRARGINSTREIATHVASVLQILARRICSRGLGSPRRRVTYQEMREPRMFVVSFRHIPGK